MQNMQYFYRPQFNPIFFSVGPISFHWYGIMYGLSFILIAWLLSFRIRHYHDILWNHQDLEYLLYLSFFGILLGGRIGYVLFYQWSFFVQNIWWIFYIWEGGMSFHGGLIGVIISIQWFSYRKKQSFFEISDLIASVIPIGLGLGRLGNFINGELWGRISTNTPWAMLFPNAIHQDICVLQNNPQWKSLFDYYGALPRHPSQLYEMFLEGIILFIIMNIFIRKPHPIGSVSGLFLIFYGVFRIVVEFFRQPDNHLGLIHGVMTMGQILSFPMIMCGIVIMFIAYKNKSNSFYNKYKI